MNGGTGFDRYHVDNAGDRVVDAAGDDEDEVIATVSFTLPAFVEYLSLEGTGNINGSGNDLRNGVFGNSGNNVLRGFAGEDWLVGQDGNDTLDGGTARTTWKADGKTTPTSWTSSSTWCSSSRAREPTQSGRAPR